MFNEILKKLNLQAFQLCKFSFIKCYNWNSDAIWRFSARALFTINVFQYFE